MPKVVVGKPDYEKDFGTKLKGCLIGSGKQCKQAARCLDVTDRTLSKRFKNPQYMTLRELKLLIRMANMPPDMILQYLYEGKVPK